MLGRPLPGPGEPLFLPDDTDGALELQADEDARCPRNHPLDEFGDVTVETLVCQACAAEDGTRRSEHRDVDESGPEAADLLDGRYYVAVIHDPDQEVRGL